MGTPQKDSSRLSDLQRGVSGPADRLLDDRSDDPQQPPDSRARHIARVNMERRATGFKVVRDSSHRCWCTMRNCIALFALLALTSLCVVLVAWCWRQAAELAEVRRELLVIHAKIDRSASSASPRARVVGVLDYSPCRFQWTSLLTPNASCAWGSSRVSPPCLFMPIAERY